jgi:hypothetical protein
VVQIDMGTFGGCVANTDGSEASSFFPCEPHRSRRQKAVVLVDAGRDGYIGER